MKHHTKNKGDIGLAFVIADLTKKGYTICLPISEHLPFDLIVVDGEGNLSRLQVKYREIKNGTVEIPFRSVYSNGKGAKAVTNNFKVFDAYAVFCPNNDKVYYYPVSAVGNKTNRSLLRVEAPKNNSSYIKASDFENASAIFGSVA